MKKHFTKEEAKKIGDKLGITWKDWDVEQFRMGLDVELEHGKINKKTNVTNDNPITTGKIALAHLNEFADYYTRLDNLEEEAEKFWAARKTKNLKKTKTNWKLLIICLVSVYAVAFIGSLFTSSAVKSAWYESIKPSITPPSIVFPIVWNILFFLIAISLYFALTSSKDSKDKRKVLDIFVANFILNILWSVLYFGLKNPLASFIEIIFLAISIVLMITVTWKISKKSAYLLVPYLLWVCFASILNYLSIK